MYQMNEIIELRLAAYKKLEEYRIQSNLSKESYDKSASELLGERGLGKFLCKIAEDLCYSFMIFTVLIFILFFMLVAFDSDGSFMGIHTHSGLITFSSILLILSTSLVLWDSVKNIKNHKEKREVRRKAKRKAKKLKTEKENLFKVYEEKLLRLDISQYKGKNELFYEKLTNEEALVLKEYKNKQEQRPNGELMNYLGCREEQLIFNE